MRSSIIELLGNHIRELKQQRPRQQQERPKFAYFMMKIDSFACAFFIFKHFADVLIHSMT